MTLRDPSSKTSLEPDYPAKAQAQIRYLQEQQVRLSAVKSHLKKAGMETGQGWEGVKESIGHYAKQSSYDANTTLARLHDITKEIIECGDKSVFIYKIPEDLDIDEIESKFWSVPIEYQDPMVSNFPEPLPLSHSSSEAKPRVVNLKRDKLNKKIALFFGSIKKIKTKHEIYLNTKLLQEEELADLDTLVGYKTISRYSFDTIQLNLSERSIEFCLDSPTGISKENIDHAIYDLLDSFNKLKVTDKLSRNDFMEMITLVAPFSNTTEKDINVIELSFVSSDGIIMGERCKSKKTDVREGLFHKGGMTSRVGIQPFAVALKWEHSSNDIKSSPEISVPGKFSNLHKGGDKLDYIQICSCYTTGTFRNALDKIYEYREKT